MSQTTRSICPACRKKEGVPVLYGFPSKDDFERNERGEVILAGCVVDAECADQQCRSCSHSWSSTDTPGDDETDGLGYDSKALLARDGSAFPSGDPSQNGPSTRGDSVRKRPGGSGHARKVSLLPTVAFFILALFVGHHLVGAATCADGWRSGSIGHAGACSHHGGVSRLPGMVVLVASYFLALLFHRFRASRAG